METDASQPVEAKMDEMGAPAFIINTTEKDSPCNPNPQPGNNGKLSILERISDIITGTLEIAFFKLGKSVGRSPWITIILSVIISMVCLIGLLRFQKEGRFERMWVPAESQAFEDKDWVEARFPENFHAASFIIQDSNVLTAAVLRKMMKIHQRVVNISIIFEGKKVLWEDICFKIGEKCVMKGILELWSFNQTVLEETLTNEEIIDKIEKRPGLSPYSKTPFNLERVLGGISKRNGTISGGKVLKASYALQSKKKLEMSTGEEVDEIAEMWEKEFSRIFDEQYQMAYFTHTKFLEISQTAINGDIKLLSTGYSLVVLYVAFMLGKFTRLEAKVWLAFVGVFGVAMSIGVSVGLCSAMGLLFGTAHMTLPFLLLGIGVDDIFIIIQSWSNMSCHDHRTKPVDERIGLALKNSGTSITITTVTDVLAFLVGGTTILPGLKSFCFYAAVGVLSGYVLQMTFFVAWLAIDARRQSKRRDSCLNCITLPQDYKPNNLGTLNFLQLFFEKIYAKCLLKLPIKILVFAIVSILLGINVYGSFSLRQHFEPKWILPKESIIRKYIDLNEKEFPQNGHSIGVYTGSMDYHKEQSNLHSIYKKLQNEKDYLSSNSVQSWYEEYIRWMKLNMPKKIDKNNSIIENLTFYRELHVFLNSSEGRQFFSYVKWDEHGNVIKASCIPAVQNNFVKTGDKVKAMDSLRELVKTVNIFPKPRVYGEPYLWVECYKVIANELWRNVLLAAAVVFIVTFVIIANPLTSVLVFLCVVFTVVDVTGLMYYWGLTIEIVSTVVLIIAVGLSVDYASHVGHAFLVEKGTTKERTSRALSAIGPAVWNGGFSTFLAIVLLSLSESYIFMTFFKVLSGVVLFGLFHGLAFLPVILSIIGPAPYTFVEETGNLLHEPNATVKNTVQCHINETMEIQEIDHL